MREFSVPLDRHGNDVGGCADRALAIRQSVGDSGAPFLEVFSAASSAGSGGRVQSDVVFVGTGRVAVCPHPFGDVHRQDAGLRPHVGILAIAQACQLQSGNSKQPDGEDQQRHQDFNQGKALCSMADQALLHAASREM